MVSHSIWLQARNRSFAKPDTHYKRTQTQQLLMQALGDPGAEIKGGIGMAVRQEGGIDMAVRQGTGGNGQTEK